MSVFWQALYVFWIAGEVVIAIGTRRTAVSANVQDRGTQILLWVVIVLSLTLSGFLRALLPAAFRWHIHWLNPLGVMLFVLGLSVRIAAILTLGRSFTANVVTHPDQKLNRSGLYRIVRHPSYLGMEIIFLGIGLHSGAWPTMITAFVPPTLAVLYRICVEEAALMGAFGNEYEEYRQATKRLIPGLY
jgi:protein-S-isoprenylcysteine O-methyltransferase Ste14